MANTNKNKSTSTDVPKNEVDSTINQEYLALKGLYDQVKPKEINIGKLLKKRKDEIPHGMWKKHVKDTYEFSYSMACRYMKCAKEGKSLKELYGEPKVAGSSPPGKGKKEYSWKLPITENDFKRIDYLAKECFCDQYASTKDLVCKWVLERLEQEEQKLLDAASKLGNNRNGNTQNTEAAPADVSN